MEVAGLGARGSQILRRDVVEEHGVLLAAQCPVEASYLGGFPATTQDCKVPLCPFVERERSPSLSFLPSCVTLVNLTA